MKVQIQVWQQNLKTKQAWRVKSVEVQADENWSLHRISRVLVDYLKECCDSLGIGRESCYKEQINFAPKVI